MEKPKKNYVAPQLIRHGSMKTITLQMDTPIGTIPPNDLSSLSSGT
jgi:hypothetical protein